MRIEQEMTPSRFQALSDAFGGDIERWPAAERDRARTFAARDPAGGAALADARGLDRLLATVPPVPEPSAQLIDRIVAAAPLQGSAGASAADNVIVLPRAGRAGRAHAAEPVHRGEDRVGDAAEAEWQLRAGWQLKAGRLAGAGGMLAASFLIGIWLGASGVGASLPGTTFGARQGIPSPSETDAMSEMVQAAFPPELGDTSDEDAL